MHLNRILSLAGVNETNSNVETNGHVEILHICYHLYFKIKFLKEEDKFIEV